MLQKRRGRPIFFVDIAVPRDVDPGVNRLDGVFLYDIDDLQSVAASHLATRGKEAEKAERIIQLEVDRFQLSLRTLDVVPAIVEMQKNFENTRQGETRRMQSKLQSLTPEQKTAVEALTRGLMNKYLHQTVHALKSAAREGDAAAIRNICEVFEVDTTAMPIVRNQILAETPVEIAPDSAEAFGLDLLDDDLAESIPVSVGEYFLDAPLVRREKGD